MPGDGGKIAVLAQWMVDQLAALKYEEQNVFVVADLYKHQLTAASGGVEKIEATPIAYVDFRNTESGREGNKDLREVYEFAILIAVKTKADGLAKWGEGNNLGLSKIRDLVIDLFDKKRPDDETVKCDEFYYTGDFISYDFLKVSGIQMQFEVSQMKEY
jgi:hypothetical protein